MTPKEIAKICHEANRAFCQTQGDFSQLPWQDAPEWQRASALDGVEFILANLAATSRDSHETWMKEKLATGWKYGSVKDSEKKEHPSIVPYDDLPQYEKQKDALFVAIVKALASNAT